MEVREIKNKIVRSDFEFRFEPVAKKEVTMILKLLKASKSAGVDDIPPKMVKDAAEKYLSIADTRVIWGISEDVHRSP